MEEFAWTTNDRPIFLNLYPKDVVKIPVHGVKEFLNENLLNKSIYQKELMIALVKDSVYSPGLNEVLNIAKNQTNGVRWYVRMATPEEIVVLRYKINNESYSPFYEKWDSTKIQFDNSDTPN